MRKAVKLRALTTEEVTEIKRIAASRKESIRRVQRVRVIVLRIEDPKLRASEAGVQASFKSQQMGPE